MRRRRKSFVIAVLLVVLYAINLFYISDLLQVFGIWGTVFSELLLAATGIVVFRCFRGKFSVIYPFAIPERTKIAGTIFLWIGSYAITMCITMIVAYFFPEQVLNIGQGIEEIILYLPFHLSFFVIAVSPAICEELAFRGALYSCFRCLREKWVGVVIVSLIFGAFHGSIWRMIPTTLLGIAMGFLILETENMCYNILFHLINNAFPIVMNRMIDVLTGGMMSSGVGTYETDLPLASVGIYLLMGSMAPIFLYLAVYYLRKGEEHGESVIFPKEKNRQMKIVIGSGIAMVILGFLCLLLSLLIDPIFVNY